MPIQSMETASVFYDGIFDEPVRLAHPEGVAVDRAGNVWCGTETGHLLKIEADGSEMNSMGCTGGWIAGIAFDGDENLFACDIRDGHMYRLDVKSGAVEKFGEKNLNIPNYPVVDIPRNALYVSDSYSFEEPGPGIWRFDLDTGDAELWYAEPLAFANGMAMEQGGNSLLVVESTEKKLTRVHIDGRGNPTSIETVATGLASFPDGVAVAADGTIFVSCYEPSQIYRILPGQAPELFIHDDVATTIAHPTNMAFRGSEMFTTNLGRWHITSIVTDTEGLIVPVT